MPSMISYSVGYTAIDANSGTTVTVAPPPVYAAGDLLVMGVIAGGTSNTVVGAGTPSGWTAVSGGGTAPGVFRKTATGSEPSSYTVTLGAASCAAVFVAAYPAATVVSSAFRASGTDVTSYTPAFPSGVTSGETVLLIAGAVAADGDANGNAGGQNLNLPSGSGWATEVPVFGPALPGQSGTIVYPCAIGLADITGSTSAQALTSPQGCNISAAYLVLNITGSAPAAPYTVTATASGPASAVGVVMTVKALSGAQSALDIFNDGAYSAAYGNGVSQAPEVTLTPAATGSIVYGAVAENIGVTGGTTFTAASGTTFTQNVPDPVSDVIYGTFRSTGTTTSGTPVTLGGSAPGSAYFTAAAAEILAAGTLAETATVTVSGLLPGAYPTTTLALPAYFPSQPAPGSLIVALISANSSWTSGAAVFAVTDNLGLTWYEQAAQAYPSYSGVWIASLASPTASASLTVTPARSATARRGHYRTAALTVTPVRRAVPSGLHYSAAASLTVTPVRTATARVGAPASAVLDEAGSPVLDEAGGFVLDETGTTSLTATASLTVAPSRSAARARGHYRSAALTVTPVRSASPSGAHYNVTATLVVTPSLTATTGGSGAPPANAVLDEAGFGIQDEAGGFVLDESTPGVQRASASLTVTPVLTATAEVPANAGPWSAARAGLPGDSSATNWASQVTQFLTAHRVTPVYQGTRIWEVAAVSTGVSGAFSWLGQPGTGWLPAYDVSQPFTLAAGFGSVGRVQVPVQASGNGADLQVLLCADSAGSPNLASPLASVIIPASHVTQASATGSLAGAGPLVVARHNTSLIGAYSTGPWTQPAVSSNGAGSFATPATSGNFTALIGGLDSVANVASGYTATIAYQGGSVSGGITQPALPQPAWFSCAAITADSVVVAGGKNATAEFATVWTAPWTPGTGTIGAWSQQTALPAANVYGAMAAWNTTVYVIGGSPNAAAASATALVWTASSQSGQITAWTECPPLPQALMQAYCAVVGNWLIVCGGTSTSNAAVTSTWYSAINADGSLAGWQQGPPLPEAVAAFGPGWNTAVTDSALIIVSGFAGGESFSPYAQVLSVSPDGVSDAWQVQDWSGSTVGAFQCGIYPSGPSGQWQLFNLHTTSYDVAGLGPVALVSVPLPTAGLTAGDVYHVVIRQSGGNLNDSLAVGVLQSSGTGWLHAPRGSDASWTSTAGQQVAMNVYDGSAAGNALHLVQDSGAGLTTLIRGGSDGLLAGIMESASFPTESPEAVLGTVTEVTWSGGLPSGLVTLA
jgi:hypothetical protein